MSERNVELMRRVLKAYNARDIEAMIAYSDPAIEFHAAFEADRLRLRDQEAPPKPSHVRSGNAAKR